MISKILIINSNANQIPLADKSVQCCVTSPPYYGLRDYGEGDRLGLEPTLSEYIENMCRVFDEVWRVLRDDGTCWVNMGDSYNGSGGAGGDYNAGGLKEGQPRYPGRNENGLKPKDLMGVPWRLAFALQERGWWLRSDIIWHKPNPMPESVTDRPTKSHEYIFLLTKSARYYYDADAIREGSKYPDDDRKARVNLIHKDFQRDGNKLAQGSKTYPTRNKRTVWTVTTKPYSGAHFATFPPDLIEPCILAGTSEKGQCPECGAPWERVVDKKVSFESASGKSGNPINGKWIDDMKRGGGDTEDIRLGPTVKITTTGWRPTCGHGLDPVPQVVLDPFGGSGTTAIVANKLGRIGISADLSLQYSHLAKERSGLKDLEEWTNGKQTTEANIADLPLFSALTNDGTDQA